jgi:uncharacterized protein
MPDAAICFVVGTAVAIIAVSAAIGAGAGDTSLAATTASLLGLWIGLLGSMWLVWRAKGGSSFAGDFGLKVRWPRDLIGVPIGIVTTYAASWLLYLPLSRFIDVDKVDDAAKELADRAGRGLGLAALAVLVVIGAPIVEELFYRGMLLATVRRRFGSRIAIGASATIFAAAHFELLQFPALLALGLVLGYLAVRYERIGPCIWVHSTFNAVAMIGLIYRAYS